MIKKSFSVLLCGLMLVQGYGLPILTNEEEMEELQNSSIETNKKM